MTKVSELCLRLPLLTAHTSLMLLKSLRQFDVRRISPPYVNIGCNIAGCMMNILAYTDDMVLLVPS